MSARSLAASTERRAGPPRRNVVRSRSSTTSDTDDRLRHAEHLGSAAGHGEDDRGSSVRDVADLARHLDLDTLVVVGDHDRVGELAAELDGSSGACPLEIGRAPSELQSIMRTSYAVFCLKTKKSIQPKKKRI